MAIRRIYNKRFKGINVRSGYIYKFKYQGWENDPEPLAIIMYALEGLHPNTGHQWRFFQAINFSYIPRSDRKRFAKEWVTLLEKTNNPRFTWEKVKSKYPYLENAVRRYFFRPNYYIKDLKEIPLEEIEKEIIGTYAKDFSKKVKSFLLSKFRGVLRRRQSFKRTGKFPPRR